MDYDVFVKYAIPVLVVAILVVIGLVLLLKFSKKESPPWVGALIIYTLLGAIAVIMIIGTLLGWETPI